MATKACALVLIVRASASPYNASAGYRQRPLLLRHPAGGCQPAGGGRCRSPETLPDVGERMGGGHVGRFPIGVPELIILIPVAVAAGAVALFLLRLRRHARRFGYGSTLSYLRAVPRSDAEKRDAADLALKGLMFCLVGLILPPLILIGLVPLYYGGRKVLYAFMGLGLVDDGDEPGV
jgi:hypothetical protein